MIRTTTAPLTIPATGLEHRSGDVVITATPTAQAGYRVQVRIAGVFNADLSSGHVFETNALRAYRTLVAQYPAAPEPTHNLAPAAKGAQTKVSDPQHTALAIASVAGHIERGGKPGQAAVNILKALAKRGYLNLTYSPTSRFTVTGGNITTTGQTRLNQLTAADRELADFTARLQSALTFDLAAAAPAPVAA